MKKGLEVAIKVIIFGNLALTIYLFKKVNQEKIKIKEQEEFNKICQESLIQLNKKVFELDNDIEELGSYVVNKKDYKYINPIDVNKTQKKQTL